MKHETSPEKRLAEWERLAEIIRRSGLSINAFSPSASASPRGENLYRIRRGANGISRDLAERIHARYPQYSIRWLLSGDEQEDAPEKPPPGLRNNGSPPPERVPTGVESQCPAAATRSGPKPDALQTGGTPLPGGHFAPNSRSRSEKFARRAAKASYSARSEAIRSRTD